jgi:hypothetical protein
MGFAHHNRAPLPPGSFPRWAEALGSRQTCLTPQSFSGTFIREEALLF